MPTSAPGSKPRRPARVGAGFTLLELLIVITVIALSTGLSILALRDSSSTRLEQEAARLSALLEAARVESRTSGRMITWRPQPAAGAQASPSGNSPQRRDFLFEPPVMPQPDTDTARAGAAEPWPSRWLHEDTVAEVIGAPRLVLGPEPIIPAQRVRLRLGERQLVLATDGLAAFAVEGSR